MLEWDNEQKEIANLVVNSATFQLNKGDCIIAFDIAYNTPSAKVCCDISYWDTNDYSIKTYNLETKGEYKSGYFAFYEGPLILKALEGLAKENIIPKLILVDGHGSAHPRKCGLANYIGVKTNTPTIGLAKNTMLNYIGELGSSRGSILPILLNNEVIGNVLRTQDNVKPIFVSIGNLITLDKATEIAVKLASKYRIPEPIRRADIATKAN